MADDRLAAWRACSDEALGGIAAWRAAQPHPTLTAIETTLDAHLARLRVRILQDCALASPTVDWTADPATAPPTCPDCAQPLQARGTATRHLQTQGGEDLSLPRRYATCPACGRGLFPPG